MPKNVLLISALFLFFLSQTSALADGPATRSDAVGEVKAAIASLKSSGVEATYTEINNPNGKYTKADLYLVVYDLNGKCLAHGQNPGLIGKDLTKLKDVEGKPFVQERIDLAKTQDNFWQDYKYMNPATHRVADKQSYCEKSDAVLVCGGVYK